MKIHREGRETLFIVGIGGGLISGIIALLGGQAWAVITALIVTLIALAFFGWFFRNPPRHIRASDGQVISPADGTVVAIETVYEGEYFKAERLKISVYMSPLNVHLNRVPFTGKVAYVQYHAGRYLMAFHPKSSELNERNTVVFADAHGREVLVRQIAGFLARRIVCYMQPHQPVSAGQELGFIKFGSRCDIFLPTEARVLVSLQEKIRGGETILATLP